MKQEERSDLIMVKLKWKQHVCRIT